MSGKVVLLHGLTICQPFLPRSLAAWMPESGNLLKAHRQGARSSLLYAIQRNQQGDLQKAQAEHQIKAELRRERIALIERALNMTAGFVQARVVNRRHHVTSPAERQSLLQHRLKQTAWLPIGPRMQLIFRTPVLLLTPQRADGA